MKETSDADAHIDRLSSLFKKRGLASKGSSSSLVQSPTLRGRDDGIVNIDEKGQGHSPIPPPGQAFSPIPLTDSDRPEGLSEETWARVVELREEKIRSEAK